MRDSERMRKAHDECMRDSERMRRARGDYDDETDTHAVPIGATTALSKSIRSRYIELTLAALVACLGWLAVEVVNHKTQLARIEALLQGVAYKMGVHDESQK